MKTLNKEEINYLQSLLKSINLELERAKTTKFVSKEYLQEKSNKLDNLINNL